MSVLPLWSWRICPPPLPLPKLCLQLNSFFKFVTFELEIAKVTKRLPFIVSPMSVENARSKNTLKGEFRTLIFSPITALISYVFKPGVFRFDPNALRLFPLEGKPLSSSLIRHSLISIKRRQGNFIWTYTAPFRAPFSWYAFYVTLSISFFGLIIVLWEVFLYRRLHYVSSIFGSFVRITLIEFDPWIVEEPRATCIVWAPDVLGSSYWPLIFPVLGLNLIKPTVNNRFTQQPCVGLVDCYRWQGVHEIFLSIMYLAG